MSERHVPLESIRACLQGVIPSMIVTCSADGVPNVTLLSIVHYVDEERVSLTRQFFNKTRANLEVNPWAQVAVIDPETCDQFLLDLRFLHTETEGPTFDALKTNLDAIACSDGHVGRVPACAAPTFIAWFGACRLERPSGRRRRGMSMS